MQRRDLLAGTIGLAAFGSTPVGDLAAQERHAKRRYWTWEATQVFGGTHEETNESNGITTSGPNHTTLVWIGVPGRERWQLGVSRGQTAVSVPYSGEGNTYLPCDEDHGLDCYHYGFNGDGYRLVDRGRFGVLVPCRRKYRRDLVIQVSFYDTHESSGRENVYRAKGRPGRWLWPRLVETRPLTAASARAEEHRR